MLINRSGDEWESPWAKLHTHARTKREFSNLLLFSRSLNIYHVSLTRFVSAVRGRNHSLLGYVTPPGRKCLSDLRLRSGWIKHERDKRQCHSKVERWGTPSVRLSVWFLSWLGSASPLGGAGRPGLSSNLLPVQDSWLITVCGSSWGWRLN